MLRALPNPVLAVTHDVLRDVDGDDALSSLWFLFTKCKGGLHDGQRLENISWRLWHRDMNDRQSYRPLTPDSPATTATAQRSFPLAGTSPRTTVHIGKLIDDISAQAIGLHRPARSHLPTPTTEQVKITLFPAPTKPTSADPPRLVVVNPSPHPTPPASPVPLPTVLSAATIPNLTLQLPPPRPPTTTTTTPRSSLAPAAATSLKPQPGFFVGSVSSSSSASSDSSSTPSVRESIPDADESTEPSSHNTAADIPPSLCRTTTLPAGINDIAKIAKPPAAPVRHHHQQPHRAPRPALSRNRASFQAEDRDLEEIRRTEPEREEKQRREASEKALGAAAALALDLERAASEQEKRDKEQEEKRAAELKRLAREQELVRQKAKAQRERDREVLRRTASAGHLLAPADTVIFDFNEEIQGDSQHTLQPSGSSHPELNRSVFGLNRALSPPKAAGAPTSSNKGKGREAIPVQALLKDKAVIRMQSNLKGAFTPMMKGSPTRSEPAHPHHPRKASPTKSESSKSSNARHASNHVKPLTAALPPRTSSQPPSKHVPNTQLPPPAAAAPPSLKSKQKAPMTKTGRAIVLESDGEEEEETDEEWTSADEDDDEEEQEEQEEQVQSTRPKARSHSPPAPPTAQVNHRTTRNRRQGPGQSRMPADLQKGLVDELHHALEEAERHKETFTFDKLPKRSYSNLSRTNSGLLSQLMNPDPEVYRRGYASSEVGVGGSGSGMGMGSRRMGMGGAPGLHPSHSSAALPVAAQVSVGSVPGGAGVTRTLGHGHGHGHGQHGHGRERRGPARDEEMEDESDEDGEEGEENSLPVSTSVAHEKLKAIFGDTRGGGGNKGMRTAEPIRPPGMQPERRAQTSHAQSSHAQAQTSHAQPSHTAQTQTSGARGGGGRTTAPVLERTMTEPLAVPTFPYNLPMAAIPVSPRTTRQMMLRTEMSESVRTNLLWQRQQDKQQQQLMMPRRNRSSVALGGGGGEGMRSVVKVRERVAGGNGEGGGGGGGGAQGGWGGWGGGDGTEMVREEARDEIRRVNLLRNKSWAADYHPER